MRFDTEAEVDLDVDDIISEMSDDEKKEMYDALSDEFAHSAFDESFDVARYLGNCKPFERRSSYAMPSTYPVITTSRPCAMPLKILSKHNN